MSEKGIEADPKLVEAMTNYVRPRSKKGLRGFIGLCSYYREFIENFAETAAPLTDMVGSKSTFEWGDEQEKAFKELKRRLATAPVLAHPDWNKPFYLQPDASKNGYGAILSQRDEKGKEHPVTYISRRTRGTGERTANARRSEAGCIYWAVKKLRRFLEGHKFFVQTDHEPLKYLRNEKNDRVLQRQLLELEHFRFDVIYKPGKEQTNGDTRA